MSTVFKTYNLFSLLALPCHFLCLNCTCISFIAVHRLYLSVSFYSGLHYICISPYTTNFALKSFFFFCIALDKALVSTQSKTKQKLRRQCCLYIAPISQPSTTTVCILHCPVSLFTLYWLQPCLNRQDLDTHGRLLSSLSSSSLCFAPVELFSEGNLPTFSPLPLR